MTQLRPDGAGASSGQAPWTVLRLLTWTADYFKSKDIEPARRQAEDLLGMVLGLDRLHLYLEFETVATPSELKLFKEVVQRRISGEPLQYLLGWQPFAGLRIKTDPRALIPRPETETLAEGLCRRFKGQEGLRLADIGTGSGCLALALAKRLEATAWATDCSAEALSLASENAVELGLSEKVTFLRGDCLDALAEAKVEALDLVVSNPPYIAQGEQGRLPREVGAFEPAQALFSGPRGTDMLEKLIAGAGRYLKPGGLLALECGLGQPESLAAKAAESWGKAWVENDATGRARFVFCQKA